MTCKNNIKKAPAQQLPLAAGLGLFTYLPKRLDLVRAFAVASSSRANCQEYGKFVGAWIFYERIARTCLRGDAQPVLPLGELRDLDDDLALGVTYDKGDFRWRGALLVLGEVDAY